MQNDDIEKILNTLEFEKKRPITAMQKKAYCDLQQSVDDIRQRLSQLHLQLHHATENRDYHSLPIDEARQQLSDIARQIDAIANR